MNKMIEGIVGNCADGVYHNSVFLVSVHGFRSYYYDARDATLYEAIVCAKKSSLRRSQ